MKKNLKIEIECGETTCAVSPGNFCRFFGTIKFGQIFVCRLFPSEKDYTLLKETTGWVQRCTACLTASASVPCSWCEGVRPMLNFSYCSNCGREL
jgi:hypothetical protein